MMSLISDLRSNIVLVRFRDFYNSDNIKEMNCTLSSFIAGVEVPNQSEKSDSIVVYSIDKGEFRDVMVNTIVSWELVDLL